MTADSGIVTGHSGIVTGHSGIVTADSGQPGKSVTVRPESAVTFTGLRSCPQVGNPITRREAPRYPVTARR
ncbi:hypothetical protein C2U69_12990 [Cupriavidus pinatubonensis]|nr:hypothetical protein C2U69_12990 [Cupriavidus pinatubonensis]